MLLVYSEPINLLLILMNKFEMEEKSKIKKVIQYLFVALYLPVRGILFPFLVIEVQYSETPLVFRVTFGLAYLISYIWVYQILNLLAKELQTVILVLIVRSVLYLCRFIY